MTMERITITAVICVFCITHGDTLTGADSSAVVVKDHIPKQFWKIPSSQNELQKILGNFHALTQCKDTPPGEPVLGFLCKLAPGKSQHQSDTSTSPRPLRHRTAGDGNGLQMHHHRSEQSSSPPVDRTSCLKEVIKWDYRKLREIEHFMRQKKCTDSGTMVLHGKVASLMQHRPVFGSRQHHKVLRLQCDLWKKYTDCRNMGTKETTATRFTTITSTTATSTTTTATTTKPKQKPKPKPVPHPAHHVYHIPRSHDYVTIGGRRLRVDAGIFDSPILFY